MDTFYLYSRALMEPLSDVTFKTSHLFDMFPLQLNGCLYLKKVCYTWRKIPFSIPISGFLFCFTILVVHYHFYVFERSVHP